MRATFCFKGFISRGPAYYAHYGKSSFILSEMPTLDDVYRKFGEVAEAVALLETDLGTMLMFFGIVEVGVTTTFEVTDKAKAAEVLRRVNHQTLGQLIKNTKRHVEELTLLEPLLSAALEERNRLFHHFYREHNFRRNSDQGRTLMLNDLETIHFTIIEAFKAVALINGTDIEALVEEMNKTQDDDKPSDEAPLFHVKI